MNTNLGASIALSFVLVTLAAVAFRSPRGTPPAAGGLERPLEDALKTGVAEAPIPQLTPARPWSEDERKLKQASVESRDERSRPEDAEAQHSTRRVSNRPSTLATKPRQNGFGDAPRPKRAQMHAADPFTLAREGETLKDICVRIYGTQEAEEMLWKVNRDALPKRSGDVAKGTLLRTP